MSRLRSLFARFFEKAELDAPSNQASPVGEQASRMMEQLDDVSAKPAHVPSVSVRGVENKRPAIPTPTTVQNATTNLPTQHPPKRDITPVAIGYACPRCGNTAFASSPHYYCPHCNDKWLHDRQQAITWARTIISQANRSNYVILDTETTGKERTAEVVEIGILALDGRPLFDSLLRPDRPIPLAATRVHHITNQMIADAPTFPQLYEQIAAILDGRTVIVYNAEYDRSILENAIQRYNLPLFGIEQWTCAMKQYAQFQGEWNPYFKSYRWHKLRAGDHSALGDCHATLELIIQIAATSHYMDRQLAQEMASGISEQFGASQVPATYNKFAAGMKVRHRSFGDGIVVSSKVLNNDEELTVAFVGLGVIPFRLADAA